jgi:hypothetical protein
MMVDPMIMWPVLETGRYSVMPSMTLVALQDGEGDEQVAGQHHDGCHGDPARTEDGALIEGVGVAVAAAGHQQETHHHHGQADEQQLVIGAGEGQVVEVVLLGHQLQCRSSEFMRR